MRKTLAVSFPTMITRLSTLFLRTLREDPADAEVPSHKLLVRAGYVRRAAPGVYSWLPLGLRALRKIEGVVREAFRRVETLVVHELAWTATGSLRVDARCGFAFPAIAAGLDAAVERAASTGVVAVAVRNSHHAGVMGHHVERLAERGLVGLAFSNSPAGI